MDDGGDGYSILPRERFEILYFIETSEHNQLQEDEQGRNRKKVFCEKARGMTQDKMQSGDIERSHHFSLITIILGE